MTTITALLDYPKESANTAWTLVEQCPACGSGSGMVHGILPDRDYVFGSARIPLPATGIAVIGCRSCGLVYKSQVPSRSFLRELFERHAAAVWADPYDFESEVALIERFVGRREFDLLDVGAAGGTLLKACARSGVAGRLSGLDITRHPAIDDHLAGEFISGFLDDAELSWSNEPYDAVTLFDVLEHLYQPQIAFEHLRRLVKPGGLVFIESGNVQSFWPQHFGLDQWWYVRLLEHHVFWCRSSLERIARGNGFEVVFWQEVRHKSRRRFAPPAVQDLLKVGLYWTAPRHYAAIARLFGKQGNQPWHPFARDHFRACLARR